MNAIGNINYHSAKDPDNIPVSFYKNYADEISPILQQIWRHSLDSRHQPDKLILSVITSFHKGGPNCDAINYRPIALTNHLTKIFECALKKKQPHEPTQYEFHHSSQSTITELLQYYDSVMEVLEEVFQLTPSILTSLMP